MAANVDIYSILLSIRLDKRFCIHVCTFACFTPFFFAQVSRANNTIIAIVHALFMNGSHNI